MLKVLLFMLMLFSFAFAQETLTYSPFYVGAASLLLIGLGALGYHLYVREKNKKRK